MKWHFTFPGLLRLSNPTDDCQLCGSVWVQWWGVQWAWWKYKVSVKSRYITHCFCKKMIHFCDSASSAPHTAVKCFCLILKMYCLCAVHTFCSFSFFFVFAVLMNQLSHKDCQILPTHYVLMLSIQFLLCPQCHIWPNCRNKLQSRCWW